jgi:hypothetical protein
VFEQAPPPVEPPAFEEPPTIAAEEPQAPPTFEVPPAYEPAPPAYEAPPPFEEIGAPPVVGEEPAGAPADLEQMPPELAPWEIESVPPAGEIPPLEAPPALDEIPPAVAEEEKPFDTEGIMEQVRPEASNPEDFKLPPEYQELIGERPVEPEHSAASSAQIATEPLLPAEEPGGHEWPFDEVPSAETAPAPAAPEQPPWETDVPDGSAPPPAQAPQDIDLTGDEDEGVTVEEAPQPPAPARGGEELNSFFFEEDVEKKGKDQKQDPDSFWE